MPFKSVEKRKEYYREYQRKWAEATREHLLETRRESYQEHKERISKAQYGRRRANPERTLLHIARSRAKRKHLDFSIGVEDISIPARCPILDIPIFNGVDKVCPNSPSVDRLNSDFGYIKGNVRVISHRANQLKSDMSIETVRNLLRYMEENVFRQAE